VCGILCFCPHDKTKTVETKITKPGRGIVKLTGSQSAKRRSSGWRELCTLSSAQPLVVLALMKICIFRLYWHFDSVFLFYIIMSYDSVMLYPTLCSERIHFVWFVQLLEILTNWMKISVEGNADFTVTCMKIISLIQQSDDISHSVITALWFIIEDKH